MFSIPVYNLTSNRLRTGAERQAEYIRKAIRPGKPPASFPELVQIREEQLSEDRAQLLSSLIIVNLSIIAIGGYLSYLFAKQTLRPIQEAHKLQKDFTANASHELRTPLAVIQAQSEVTLRNKKLTLAVAKDTISSNLEEVSRLQNITSQLLNLTKIGGDSKNFKAVDLVKIIKPESELYKKTSQADIELNLAKDVVIQADSTLLRQAIGIILDNAIKYTKTGNKPEISITLSKSRSSAKIKIADKGIGIVSEEKAKIFDRFFRGKNTEGATSANGNGLGLAIAKQIIDQHHGEISLEKSSPSKGSTFCIKLPLKKNDTSN